MSYTRRLAAMLLFLSPMVLFVNSTSAAAFKRVHEGEEAPGFTLTDTDGNPLDLAAFKDGPLTIVTFWALWNPKSEPLLKDIQKLLDEFGEAGVKALGVKAVAVNAEGQNPPADLDAQVKEYIQKNGLKFPIVLDRNLEQYEKWGVIALPATAFLGKDLKVIYEFSGHPTSAYEEMRDHVLEALGIKEEAAVAAKPKRERFKPTSKASTQAFGLSKVLYERGQFAQAAKKLEKVIADEPKFSDAQALNGAIQLGMSIMEGKADGEQLAKDAFAKALELDPTTPMALAGQAHLVLKGGDAPKALELARKALEFTETVDVKALGHKRGEERKASILDIEAPLHQQKHEMRSDRMKLRDSEGAEAQKAAEGAAPDTKPEEKADVKPEAAAASKAPPPDVAALLASAEKALAANDTKAAATDIESAVKALLMFPQGPKMKKEGLIEKVRKAQQPPQ